MTSPRPTCKICGCSGREVGTVDSPLTGRQFHMAHCDECRFSWVTDPRTDFADVYSEDYYAGKGADTNINYVFDACHPDRTAQADEWRGVLRYVSTLKKLPSLGKGLDESSLDTVRMFHDDAVSSGFLF